MRLSASPRAHIYSKNRTGGTLPTYIYYIVVAYRFHIIYGQTALAAMLVPVIERSEQSAVAFEAMGRSESAARGDS